MYHYKYPHPAVTTDSIIFTVRDTRLLVMLIQRGQPPQQGYWAFPGGFINIDEDLDDAVRRELQEETGLTEICLRQFYTFGAPDRDPRERVITVAYLALVPDGVLDPVAADDAAAVAWFSLNDLPPLAFDHSQVLATAHAQLCDWLLSSDIALRLLPDNFLASQLCDVYAAIAGHEFAETRLIQRLLDDGLIVQAGCTTDGQALFKSPATN